ncbi:MAG: UDP-3-O-(3-hydroxymyristoyl)glucosamine N-acyltransferase [Leptolyngbyaceae cyanobacterium SL_7_1]|nr:UDP-3-O-(3-hydroxymyristoyl)glucosamine N-acyltransferase [Leptolyngbyaceae cyanobacterium SL_7_1]
MKFSDVVSKLATVEQSSLNQHPTLDPEITGMAAIDEATVTTLSYIEGDKFASQIDTTAATALILPRNEGLQVRAAERGMAWVASPYPRLTFAEAIALFYQPFVPTPEIHPTAVIDPSATIGNNVAIGAHVVIQASVTVGDGVRIHPNVVIYPEAKIGDRTTLHANCVIHERTQIGSDCVIHSGAAIGSEGFGFVPTAEGWFKMQQSGRTVLEEGVEIGCNSTVDRPAVGETRIGRYTKLDNLVHIAHSCQIGEACAMAAQVGMAGGVNVGDRVILGGQVGIANQVNIGDGVQAGAQCGIHSDIAAGAIVLGSPAIPFKQFLRVAAAWNRLPEMQKTLRDVQKQLGLSRD